MPDKNKVNFNIIMQSNMQQNNQFLLVRYFYAYNFS